MQFSDFYIKARPEKGVAGAVWPTPKDKLCPSLVSDDKTSMTFPKLPIRGAVNLGVPPKGDFVPEGVAGLAYVSPSYQ